MIRKTVKITLLIVFLLSSVGYSVSNHYCGNARISASIGMQAKSCCGDESGTCCHNETKHYQIEDSYVASTQDINDQTKSISDLIFFVSNLSQFSTCDVINTEIQLIAESPPPISLNTQLSILQTYLL